MEVRYQLRYSPLMNTYSKTAGEGGYWQLPPYQPLPLPSAP